MRPPRSWQIPLVLLILACCCAAQRNFELHPTETIPLEYNLQSWGAPQLQCDSDGNLYMLALSAEDSSRDHLLRVSADAKETTQIDPRSVPELQGFRILPVFAPGPRGEFVLVALKTPSEGTNEQQSGDQGSAGKGHSAEVYVASFDRGGNFISNAKLDVPVEPKAIAAFDSGELLISGAVSSFNQHSESQEPFTGIFARDGFLLRKVDLPRNPQIPKGGATIQDAGSGLDALDATKLSRAGSAGDASVYLVQSQLEMPTFLLISSEGKVVRTIRISRPERGTLRDVRFAGGRMLAMYMRTTQLPGNPKGELATDSEIFQILNVENGEKIAEYERRRPFLGNLACYASDALTFLRMGENRRLELVRAEMY